MTRHKRTLSSKSQTDDDNKTTPIDDENQQTDENVKFSSESSSTSKISTTTNNNTSPNNNNNNTNNVTNRTSHTARRLSRIYRSSPVTVDSSSTTEQQQQLPTSMIDNSFAVEKNTTSYGWDDDNIIDNDDEEEEALSPPQIITKSPTPSSSSPNFKLNLSNIKSFQSSSNNTPSSSVLQNNSPSHATSSVSTTHQLIKTPRGRSVSEAILPNSARHVINNSLESSEFQQAAAAAVNPSGRITSRINRTNVNSRRNQSSPYYIPPPATQSPRSILSNNNITNNINNTNSSTPRTRSPATQSPRSALTPRQVTFFDESPTLNGQLPHSANAILLNQQQLTPDYIFQIRDTSLPSNSTIVSGNRSQSPASMKGLAPKHLQGNLQIPLQEKNTLSPASGGGNVGPKSPLAPSVYESIFGHSKQQSIMFRHSFGNEFEAREDEEDDEISDLSFNHKSPNNLNYNQSNRTASPQLTPRRLAQMASSVKARISPRNKAEKEGFSGLIDESSSVEMHPNVDIFANDIGTIIHSHDHINDVKSDDECSVRHVVQDIDMHEVIASAMDLKPHHIQSISGDSINRDALSPNYLIPNMDSTESSCQSPPTTSQLVMSASASNINKPIHTYSTSDLTTISPGMLRGRTSVGTDAEGKSVASNHKRKQLFKVRTCCGTIELSIFKVFALASLFVNTLAFVWLAILLSLIYANQIDQYTLDTVTSLKSTKSIQYTREMMSYLTKATAYASTCGPLLLKYENVTYCNETMYTNKFESNYLSLMSDLNASKAFLSSEIVKNLENSSYMAKDFEAYQLIQNGQALDALKLLESEDYAEQYKLEKEAVVDPIYSFFNSLELKKTYEMSLFSLMGLIVVACVFAFVVPLFIFILVCAFNRDSLHLERLNKANAVMLMDTMNNETLRELFKKHCEVEYASENFSILEKINEYKQLCEKSFEIQVALFDIENNGTTNEIDISSPVKRKPGMEIEYPNSPISPMRRKQSSADSRDSKRLKLFKKQFSEKDLERIEQEKYEIAFEIFTDYIDINGERSVNINKTLSDRVKEQMDSYAKGMIDFLSDNLFDVVELEVCVVLLDTHYRFKESLSFQKQMKIDKINKAKLVRRHRVRSLRHFQ